MVKHYLSNWARMERHCSFSSGQHPIQSRQLRIRREGEKKKQKPVDATGSGSRLNLQKVRASQNMQCSSIENRIYEPHNMNIVHIGRKREPQCVAKSRG
jgi:hypothetical protein